MATTTLVNDDIKEGRRLLEELDKRHIKVDAALWLLRPEDEWRLILATPAARKSAKSAYERIQKVITNAKIRVPLRAITIVSPEDELISMLKRALVTGPGISEIRFSGNTIGNVYINDALIYRINFDSSSSAF